MNAPFGEDNELSRFGWHRGRGRFTVKFERETSVVETFFTAKFDRANSIVADGNELQTTVFRNCVAIDARIAASPHPPILELHERSYRMGATDRRVRQLLIADPDGYLIRLSEVLTGPAGS